MKLLYITVSTITVDPEITAQAQADCAYLLSLIGG